MEIVARTGRYLRSSNHSGCNKSAHALILSLKSCLLHIQVWSAIYVGCVCQGVRPKPSMLLLLHIHTGSLFWGIYYIIQIYMLAKWLNKGFPGNAALVHIFGQVPRKHCHVVGSRMLTYSYTGCWLNTWGGNYVSLYARHAARQHVMRELKSPPLILTDLWILNNWKFSKSLFHLICCRIKTRQK